MCNWSPVEEGFNIKNVYEQLSGLKNYETLWVTENVLFITNGPTELHSTSFATISLPDDLRLCQKGKLERDLDAAHKRIEELEKLLEHVGEVAKYHAQK